MLWGCCEGVVRVLWGCSEGVVRVLWGCREGVVRVLWGCCEMFWDVLMWDVLRCSEMLWDVVRCCEMLWEFVWCCEMLWDVMKCCEMLDVRFEIMILTFFYSSYFSIISRFTIWHADDLSSFLERYEMNLRNFAKILDYCHSQAKSKLKAKLGVARLSGGSRRHHRLIWTRDSKVRHTQAKCSQRTLDQLDLIIGIVFIWEFPNTWSESLITIPDSHWLPLLGLVDSARSSLGPIFKCTLKQSRFWMEII